MFYCVNKGFKGKQIFSSQVGDGICGIKIHSHLFIYSLIYLFTFPTFKLFI